MNILIATGIAGLLLIGGGTVHAQTSSRTPAEQHNLEVALDFIQNVITPLKVERFKDYVAPTFIEHNPEVEGNLASLVSHFKNLKSKFPNGLPPAKIIEASVDGDLVTVILVKGTETDPHDATKKYWKLGIEMFRLKNGKQVEHWDETMIPTGD